MGSGLAANPQPRPDASHREWMDRSGTTTHIGGCPIWRRVEFVLTLRDGTEAGDLLIICHLNKRLSTQAILRGPNGRFARSWARLRGCRKPGDAPEEFYGQFCPASSRPWRPSAGPSGRSIPKASSRCQYQINIQETQLRDNEQKMAQHGRLLGKMLTCGNGMLVPPHSGPGKAADSEPEAAANPTEFLLVFGLLKTDLETVGLVEIFQRFEAGPDTQKGYLRFLCRCANWPATS